MVVAHWQSVDSFDGLSNLTSIGGFLVFSTPSKNLDALSNLAFIGGDINVFGGFENLNGLSKINVIN